MTKPDTAAGIPYEGTDCTPEEAVEAVEAVRATAALPFSCCGHCACPNGERIGHDDTCSHGCNDNGENDEALPADPARPATAELRVCDRCSGRDDVRVFEECGVCGNVPLCVHCRNLHREEIARDA